MTLLSSEIDVARPTRLNSDKILAQLKQKGFIPSGFGSFGKVTLGNALYIRSAPTSGADIRGFVPFGPGQSELAAPEPKRKTPAKRGRNK